MNFVEIGGGYAICIIDFKFKPIPFRTILNRKLNKHKHVN